MNYDMIIWLIYNLAILLSINMVYILMPSKFLTVSGNNRFLMGLIIGLITVIIMVNPYKVAEGIQFDARSIVICIAGMFMGVIPTTVAAIIASIFRIVMGGDGAIAGVLVITCSACIGLVWRKLFYKKICEHKKSRILNLCMFGICVHVAYTLCLLVLPEKQFIPVFSEVSIPILIVFPIGTVLVALTLLFQIDKEKSRVALVESRNRNYAYFENAPYGIFIADKNSKFLDVNKAATVMLGYSKEELLQMSSYDITAEDNTNEQKNGYTTLTENGQLNIYKKYKTKDKGIREWSVIATRLNDNLYLGFCYDVTDVRQLEKEKINLEATMRNQQKLESIGTLAGGVAHEINNPINGIINYGQLIIDTEIDDVEIIDYANEIIVESNRISNIVKNLLDFSRQEDKNTKDCDVKDILNHTVSLISTIFRHDQINLKINIPKDIPRVVCNGQQIQQVIMNLLTNSRDALNEKYKGYNVDKIIKVSCASVVRDKKDMIRISVKDHGNGINEEIIGKIYDPFFTTKGRDKGTGLGLTISYGIIKDHQGSLEVDTQKGRFTTFHIYLPAEKAKSDT